MENNGKGMEFNPIENPEWYCKDRKIQPIEVIEDWGLPYHLGCVVKYIARLGRKNDAKLDFDEAFWYMKRYREWRWGKK